MGLTKPRAYQIYDIDYKQAVRVVTTSDITLSGGAPNAVDGVNLVLNDRVLVTGQSTTSQNGLYYVTTLGTGANGTWSRSVDGDVTGEILAGLIVMVTEGNVYKDTQWKLTTNDPIVIGSTGLDFVINSLNVYFTSISAGGNVLTASGNSSVLNLAQGSGVTITSNTTSNTITISSSSSTPSNITSGTSNVNIVSSGGNITVGVGGTANVVVWATTGEYVTGLISASGNIQGGNLRTAGLISATGNITGGNLVTTGQANIQTLSVIGTTNANTISSSGNVTGANILTTGYVTATGNVVGGNIVTGNLVSAATVSASGNVTGGNINTNKIVGANLTVVSTGAINLQPTGNIDVNNRWITNLADPAQAQDAATKAYVDAIASNVHYHQPVNAATTTSLTSTYGGATIVYNNGASGVGANLVMTGNTYTNIDGVNIAVANSRILVKNEANATWNGIYNYSNSTVLTRTTTEDLPSELAGGDVFFVMAGTINNDTQWVETETVAAFGTSNILFTQIGGAVSYSAGNGLSLTGTQFSALTDGVTTTVNGSNQIAVKASANLTTPNIGDATGNSLVLAGNASIGNNLYVGAGANSTAFTNPVIVGKDTGVTYVQAALINTSGNGSADYAAYANNGDETQAWVDMGFTGNTFNDPAYTITKPNDGYLLAQGNASFGGNLVLATGSGGTTNDIVFATGGFLAANERMRYINASNIFSVVGNIVPGNISTVGKVTVAATTPPTADQVLITNTGQPTVTAGTSALQVDYFGGAAAIEASSARFNISPGSTAGGTWNALRIVPTAGANTSINLNGIKFDNVVAAGGVDSAINAGTGWDNLIIANGVSIINGSGIVQSVAISGSYTGITGVGTLANLTIGAGNTTVPALRLTAGNLMTTSTAGAVEYTGNALYFSSAAGNRGYIPTPHFYRTGANRTLSNVTTGQSWLGVGVTLQANTTYQFQGQFYITTTNATSHVEQIGFGGTATLANIFYSVSRANAVLGTPNATTSSATQYFIANTLANTTAAVAAAANSVYVLSGTVSTNATGTFIPQWAANSVAIGNTATVVSGAYFSISPVAQGNGNISIGTWA